MHIHLPKPLHGWREFLGEVGIIVLGVLIALAAEQFIESLHWRRQIAETRQALKGELQHDMAAIQFAEARQGCATRRLDDLQRWLAAARTGTPPALRETIGRQGSYTIRSSIWEVAKAGQAVPHMPLREQMLYARAYAQAGNMSDLTMREREAWLALGQFDGATTLDHEDMMRLQQQISTLRTLSDLYRANIAQLSDWSGPLKLTADPPLRPYAADADRSFCRPLI